MRDACVLRGVAEVAVMCVCVNRCGRGGSAPHSIQTSDTNSIYTSAPHSICTNHIRSIYTNNMRDVSTGVAVVAVMCVCVNRCGSGGSDVCVCVKRCGRGGSDVCVF